MTLAQATVLVVDDEPILRLTLGLMLERHGAKTHRAANGLEALDVLRSQTVDLMLSDRQMPIMDGLRLLHTMAAENIRVPSLLFTQSDSASPQELQALGVVQTLSKPIHPEDLIRAVADALAAFPLRP
ncbi:MAG: response regulator [Janthinobacterium lividum]